jgi:hypothetical protein
VPAAEVLIERRNYSRYRGLGHWRQKSAINHRYQSRASQRDGVTMNIGLSPLEWSRFAALTSRFPGWPDGSAVVRSRYIRPGLIGLAVAVVAGLGIGLGDWKGAFNSDTTEREPARATAAAEPETTLPPDAAGQGQFSPVAPAEAASVDGLKIVSQHWRRAGLGSKALVTFTLRNGNGYAVKDIEISCAFSRGDGSHLTDRSQIVHDTVRTRGRKTFTGIHVGFVNVNAERAKCAPVGASRI